ncbi:MAG TPA: DSD1 family PLP-dependent enzyme [Vicinamibacterales bacterium]|nr:DSD1 family PLP-dependent enzyme [Vicinamibacterales bacterium]
MKKPSRSDLLTAAAGTTAATFWIPKKIYGHGRRELFAHVVDTKMSKGVSKWDLDTPALVIDLDKLEQNIASMRTSLAGTGVGMRPHAKTHKSADIAKLQLGAGAVGVCAAKISEAEALFADGVQKILMTTANPSKSKIQRAMNIRKRNREFIQAVDYPQNAHDLSDAAKAADITADVVVDVAIGTRSGVPAGDQALALAQLIDTLPNLKLRGMLCYDGDAQHIKGYQARHDQSLARSQDALKTFERMKASGLCTEIFSGGGTGTYNIMPKVPGYTDVQVGSYVFMDAQYLEIGNERGDIFTDFAPSLTVVTTVLNTYFPKRMTTDAGTKALTLNKPDPIVIGEPGFRYTVGSDEFGAIEYETANKTYKVGDKLELIVPHCDPVVNEYDVYYGVRNDRVEVVWPVTARGKSQ